MVYADMHDRLLAQKPEGANHDPANCPFCANSELEQSGGDHMTQTYSEEEVQSLVSKAVAEATKDLQDEIASLKQESEVDAKVAAAVAELEEKIKELQSSLDTAVLEAEAAKAERESVMAWLEEETQRAEREAEIAKLREERLAQVAEVASFPQDYLEHNAERWAAMSEEDFTAALEDYRAVSIKKPEDAIPEATALVAAREIASEDKSAAKEIFSLRRSGVDPRQVV